MKKVLFLLLASNFAFSAISPVSAQEIQLDQETITLRQNEPNEESSYDFVYSGGMHKVGERMKPGKYKVFGKSDFSYYSVNSDSRGDSIIYNGIVPTFAYIVVNDGEYLELRDAFAVPAEEVPPHKRTVTLESGMYLVGYDIEAREYEIIGESDFSYYAILDGEDPTNILTNGIIENNAYVTVEDGEILEIRDASINMK